MKTTYSIIFIVSMLFPGMQAHAHHSFAAHFLPDETVEVKGTVKQFYWTNPHAFIFLNVENESGEIEEWRIEMSNTIGLTRRGWDKETIKQGDVLHITGNPARVASRHMLHIKTLQRESDGLAYGEGAN